MSALLKIWSANRIEKKVLFLKDREDFVAKGINYH